MTGPHKYQEETPQSQIHLHSPGLHRVLQRHQRPVRRGDDGGRVCGALEPAQAHRPPSAPHHWSAACPVSPRVIQGGRNIRHPMSGRKLEWRSVCLFDCRLLLGFMLVTAFLSMWISNTATTAMMVPIGHAVLEQLQGSQKDVEQGSDNPAFELQEASPQKEATKLGKRPEADSVPRPKAVPVPRSEADPAPAPQTWLPF